MTLLTGRLVVHDVTTIDPLDAARFGGKAAGLARMHRLGLPVPPAFVIDTAACRSYHESGSLSDDLLGQVGAAMAELQAATGKVFGGSTSGRPPLLVSVRSGAQISMPGMMDTVLNLGLDRRSVLALAEAAGDPTFAVESWARFWAMYADIVLDVDPAVVADGTERQRAAAMAGLSATTAAEYEQAVLQVLADEGEDAPADPRAQLTAAISAVFRSWDSRRARLYRDHHGIPHDLGTAVTVQAMVFGNLGAPAGSGVAFTRDPKTGERQLFGEYLAGGQGEDVVAGLQTPVSLLDPTDDWRPLVAQLRAFGDRLESEYRDAVDIEFTAEAGSLYMLQVRPAKRTAAAAVHIAIDLVREGVIDDGEALRRVTVEQIKRLIAPAFDEAAMAAARAAGRLLLTGIPASPGHGSGRAVLDADRAGVLAASGEPVILLRPTTSPQDLRGMLSAEAVVTARGGATSHAAVVSRALDKPCVVGCSDLEVRPDERIFLIRGEVYDEGTELSVDGATGDVLAGVVPRSVPQRNLASLGDLLERADRRSGCEVWSRAGTATAAGVAIVSLTDLLVSSGGIDELIGVIGTYSARPDAPAAEIEDVVERLAHEALTPLLRAAQGVPVHVRVPTMTSPRARRWIHEWTALAPYLLIPLGPRRLLNAYARAIGAAAADTAHERTTLLIGGITEASELAAWADMLAGSAVAAGAVLQNPVVLHAPDELTAAGHSLWIDLAELVRTSCGRPEELLYLTGDLTDPAASTAALPGLVADQLTALIRTAADRAVVGVEVAGHTDPAVTAALFAHGVRRFTSTAGQVEELRLALGRLADGEE